MKDRTRKLFVIFLCLFLMIAVFFQKHISREEILPETGNEGSLISELDPYLEGKPIENVNDYLYDQYADDK